MNKKRRIGKSKKNLLVLLLLIIILVLGIFLFSNIINYLSILEKREIYAKVIISDHYGVDVNSTALMFGMMTPGSSSTRRMNITNDHGQEVNIEIFVEGDIKGLILVSDNNFNLKVKESKKLVFTAITAGRGFGTYDGKVIFVIKNILVK